MFVDVADGKLFALRHGDRSRQTIIGVGGWTGSSELWAQPFALLSDRWSTIAYDHRGTGVSQSATASITLAQLVDDVFAVLDAFEVGRAVVAAESSGAAVALHAAAARPERVSHLVIVDGLYHVDPDPGPDAEPSEFEQQVRHSYEEVVKGFVEACLPEDHDGHLIEWGKKILLRATPEDAAALLRLAPEVDIRPQLSAISTPTLVMHGGRDVIVPIEQATQLVSMLPAAELLVLDDAGHVPTLSRPGRVADAIAAFLDA